MAIRPTVSVSSAGAAYVFRRTGTTWSQEAYVKAPNNGWMVGSGGPVPGPGTWTGGPHFGGPGIRDLGNAIALVGDTLAVGGFYESGGEAGVHEIAPASNPANDAPPLGSIAGAGAVYLFRRTGTKWTSGQYVKASLPRSSSWFGGTVALAPDGVLFVGAEGESSSAKGINGNQTDSSLTLAGAVYATDAPLVQTSKWAGYSGALGRGAGRAELQHGPRERGRRGERGREQVDGERGAVRRVAHRGSAHRGASHAVSRCARRDRRHALRGRRGTRCGNPRACGGPSRDAPRSNPCRACRAAAACQWRSEARGRRRRASWCASRSKTCRDARIEVAEGSRSTEAPSTARTSCIACTLRGPKTSWSSRSGRRARS